ncbi:hypothetical protein ABPG75_008755 [Micractinium tetrahymenae]
MADRQKALGARFKGAVIAAAVLAVLLEGAACGAAAAATAAAEGDARVMCRLRLALHLANPAWREELAAWREHQSDPDAVSLAGWRPDSDVPPCQWAGVVCDHQHHIQEILLMFVQNVRGSAARSSTAWPDPRAALPLLPELAQLSRLEILSIARRLGPLGPIPQWEWLGVGAFPRLRRLLLSGTSLGAPLPDIPPGAFPRLEHLELDFPQLHSQLPPSWGATPAVLPRLRSLALVVRVEGRLPPEWQHGFSLLTRLSLDACESASSGGSLWRKPERERALEPARCGAAGGPHQQARGGHGPLPPGWAAGFPRLEALSICGLALCGPLPASWQDGGFPRIAFLDIQHSSLTGTLPPHLLERHRCLHTLDLSGNNLTGPLPAEWAASQVAALSLRGNLLTGVAFPPAWLQAGALPQLRSLLLSSNARLHGTLPAGLAWPNLETLWLAETGVEGRIPSEWCHAPFASKLDDLWIDGSAAGPALTCGSACLQKLASCASTAGGPTAAASSNSLTEALSAGATGMAAGRAALLPAAVAAAAGMAGHVLWSRRKRARRLHQTEQQAEHSPAKPLLRDQPTELGTELEASREDEEAAQPERALRGAAARHARLVALLSRSSGLANSLAPSGQPALLAHHFAPLVRPAAHRQRAQMPSGLLAAAGSRPLALPAPGRLLESLLLRPEDLKVAHAGGWPIVLGEGAQSTVFLATVGGTEVAAKVVELAPGTDWGALWREVALLHRGSHPRVVPLLGVVVQEGLLVLVMDRMRGGPLKKALQAPSTSERLAWQAGGRQVALDVAEGLAHLHSQGVQHNDIKASNVLLTEDLRACISDLGVARAVGSSAVTAAGCTFTHAAPEQLLGERCGLAADMYSFGVLLIELTTRTPVTKRGRWRLPCVPQECSQAVLELIEQCISPDAALRPTAAEALQWLRTEAGTC